jgi:hypothetical protein
LKDPKARALTENFADQWLTTRNLQTVTPDTKMFPTFTPELKADMAMETDMFFEAVVREDRSVLDFIDGNFTFVNERLAKHYGIPGITGNNFRRVEFTDNRRGGILGHAGILTITSNPTRTSPVKRGKWILEQLLGTPPPPPPPGADTLEEADKKALTGTLRQKMEQHRIRPDCFSCHSKMDPLGFGLENFDAVGAWRTKENNNPIDASGTLPDGASFKTPAELRTILKNKKDLFVRNLAEKMLTYALGRGIEHFDKCAIDRIYEAMGRNNYKFSTLVLEIARSEPFQFRRVKGGSP